MLDKLHKNIWHAVILLFFIAIAIFLHYRASYSFPIPWADEAAFVYPAISFQQANSLHAPELNAQRAILWMPPGYMIVLGTIFKLVGFSFGLARALSLLFLIISAVFLFLILRKYRAPTIALLLCGLFLLNNVGILTGNVARMESLFLLIVFAGFFYVPKQKGLSGFGLNFAFPSCSSQWNIFSGSGCYIYYC